MRIYSTAGCIIFLTLLPGCQSEDLSESAATNMALIEIAQSQRQWTGVAVSEEGRIFVNFPRWNDTLDFSVGELAEDGAVIPYPDEAWNRWQTDLDPTTHFVCVQAVFVDDSNYLWILDPANPMFQGVVADGPKLVKVDLATDSIIRTYFFDSTVAPTQSYLNDVRIDNTTGHAFISESGLGAIIVLNLQTGEARRELHEHPSTKAEDIVLTIGGDKWLRPDGSTPEVHCDGIALHPSGRWVYYQALTGLSLYRIETEVLLNDTLDIFDRARQVELVDSTGAADGIIFDQDGNLYLSALEHDAINRYTADGELETVVKDDRISWPDTFARGRDGRLYFTTAQIHHGANPPGPYRLFVLEPQP